MFLSWALRQSAGEKALPLANPALAGHVTFWRAHPLKKGSKDVCVCFAVLIFGHVTASRAINKSFVYEVCSKVVCPLKVSILFAGGGGDV